MVTKLLGFNDAQREALAVVRGELWSIYDALKAYKQAPDTARGAYRGTLRNALCHLDLLCQSQPGTATIAPKQKRIAAGAAVPRTAFAQ